AWCTSVNSPTVLSKTRGMWSRSTSRCWSLSWRWTPYASASDCRCAKTQLHQLPDQVLSCRCVHSEWATTEWFAIVEDGLQLVERRQILSLPEQTNRNRLTPGICLFHGASEISRVVTLVFQLARALLEKLVRIGAVECEAWAEGV